MAEQLRIAPSGPDSTGEYFYKAQVGGRAASLSYRPENNYYRFEYISSHIHSGAAQLIRRFCEDVGPGNMVMGVITNAETRDALRQIGYVVKVNESQTDIPVSGSDARKLKMYNVLANGGLQNIQFLLEYDRSSPEFECCNCTFSAFT